MKESNAPVVGRTPFQKWLDKYQGLFYLIPWIIGFVVFKAVPFGQSLYYSFTDMNFFKSGTQFVGLANYITAFTTTKITKALIITFKYAFITVPLKLVFALFMAMRINSRMALVFLAVLPILAIGMGILMKVVGPVFERAFKIYDRMNTVVQENVRGIRVVKTYVREDHETEKFEGVSGMLYRTFSKAQKTMAGVMPLMQFCMYACMLLISWFGARLIVGGSMTTGELTSMFSYAMQILMSLMMVAMVFVMITMAKASAERVAESSMSSPTCTIPQTRFTRSRTARSSSMTFPSATRAMSASWRSKTSTCISRPVRPSAFSAAPVPRSLRLCS